MMSRTCNVHQRIQAASSWAIQIVLPWNYGVLVMDPLQLICSKREYQLVYNLIKIHKESKDNAKG